MRQHWRAVGLAAAALAAIALAAPSTAEAHGGRGFRGPLLFGYGAGFYRGFYPGFWGPFFPGPRYGFLPPEGGIDLTYARLMGWGAIDLHVKPGNAEVWADGQFIDQAKELDGRPSYLWLNKGRHEVVVYRGGYLTFRQSYDIVPGQVQELHLKMERGKSSPPPSTSSDARGRETRFLGPSGTDPATR